MSDNNKPDGIDIAALFFGDDNTAVCYVQMPAREMDSKFESISRDDEGPFLLDGAGRAVRIGSVDQEAFDEALGQRSFYIHLLDETGLFVEEYGVAAIQPEPASSYGA